MRLIFGLVLLVGVALAGGAVYMAQTYVGSYQAALEDARNQDGASVPLVDIYVANRQLLYGEPIGPEDVRLVKYNRDALPEGVFSENRPLFEEGQEPRVVLRDMEKNEAVLAVKLSEPGAPTGLTARLERGQRAFTIEVDVSSGVSGFLRTGDRVDVYWTGRSPDDEPGSRRGDVTRLIQTGVRLIAIDQQASNPDPGQATIARTVTVAATPQQIAALQQARATGELSLSLMGANDDTVAEAIEVDQRALFGMGERPVEEAPVVEQICTIRQRRGADVVELPIPCTN